MNLFPSLVGLLAAQGVGPIPLRDREQEQKNKDQVSKYNARLDARLAEARKRKEQQTTVFINQQRSSQMADVEQGWNVLESTVFPSNSKTISVANDPIYGGAHCYLVENCEGFVDGATVYRDGCQKIQFVQKNDDGTIIPGLQSEQLAYVLLDRAVKLNARFPSSHNEKQIAGLKMFIEGCEDRVRERIDRGVMGELKQ